MAVNKPKKKTALAGMPSWWKNTAAANPLDSFANALLPFMSPEDMRAVGTNLSHEKQYSSYGKAATYAPAPTTIDANTRNSYLSAQRASGALKAVEQMRAKTGKTAAQLGPGYNYLTDVIKTMQRLGSTAQGGMSRAQYQEFQQAISGLQSQAQDNYDISPYAGLANYFIDPKFSAGPLMNTRQVGNKTVFGTANKRLFI